MNIQNYLSLRDKVRWTRTDEDNAQYERPIFNVETGQPSTESGSYMLSQLKSNLSELEMSVASLKQMVADIEKQPVSVKDVKPVVEEKLAADSTGTI